ncbi:MAG: hypothetical protein A3J09_01730 [Candidatus Zambryskibacteria bacterium RIFCSPLOWO2_02_FULL_51_21]|uniref:Uncharacterized protein n=1 Tax=Candidatus Zambryskibacteria bacterium RIFCSPHIGHO2_02_FULL_43_37 TaxID=1802749 RepID=A0A1G2TGR7_9BACT|nr:MAG: hypothetical protein A2723_01730 [Candidatus Zambryskibacteria bacterium RIFCSPHIGHO2_01_FULL_52_18]OHA96480.1 MAG: hypothetical protein A3D49_01170 [Candidatus Zambryskibacteria bacterium RIFCSPHIGHO2_02_FULL_43_37]OHB07149.1 MAG: hypothetical protein A2944_00930 [Candidatus Zambryskibacteria bacterium RIFCSPLOWO2_01_FULL_52_12]OHB11257.1 MAG: hypothetical protein A3J09_01730 [Candidatus Zambryskibacteria bacterium RIFCSPLOWO2_02_FULL_51_21]
MENTVFSTPRPARILDAKYDIYAPTLRQMGLPTQEFRAAGMVDGRVIVHPDDVAEEARQKPFFVRRNIVEFAD